MNAPVQFAFAIGDRVRVIDLDRPATVTARIDHGTRHEFHVLGWNAGARFDVWLFTHELEALPAAAPVFNRGTRHEAPTL